jgi:hypothetical protein
MNVEMNLVHIWGEKILNNHIKNIKKGKIVTYFAELMVANFEVRATFLFRFFSKVHFHLSKLTRCSSLAKMPAQKNGMSPELHSSP